MISKLTELSVLDTQYIWENDSHIVLFVPQSQYNKQLNNIKGNNIHLATALDGYETINIQDYRTSYPCFQHGYYDLLLNGDYRIIASKRQYYLEELPRKITLKEFKERYATNNRRLKLYNDLIQLMSTISQYLKITKIMIGGSYIEHKENPSDMDLLIYVSQEEFKKIEADSNLYNKYLMLSTKATTKKLGLDLHIRFQIEKQVDLKNCCFEKHDAYADYLCERGYNIALFSQKTIYHNNTYTCTIRNPIEISDFQGK